MLKEDLKMYLYNVLNLEQLQYEVSNLYNNVFNEKKRLESLRLQEEVVPKIVERTHDYSEISKKDFSEANVQFAKKIYESFLMPLLWLGIVNVHEDTNVLQMYKMHKYMNELRVLPESVEYLET